MKSRVLLFTLSMLLASCAGAPPKPAPTAPGSKPLGQIALFEQAVAQLAGDLATQLSTHGIRSVAFVGFKSLTLDPWSGAFEDVLHDEFYQSLILASRGRFNVVARRDLQPVLDEINFMKNDEIDPATKVRLNKLVGARALIVGSLQDNGIQIKVNARIFDVERGVNLDAASTRFDRADAPNYRSRPPPPMKIPRVIWDDSAR